MPDRDRDWRDRFDDPDLEHEERFPDGGALYTTAKVDESPALQHQMFNYSRTVKEPLSAAEQLQVDHERIEKVMRQRREDFTRAMLIGIQMDVDAEVSDEDMEWYRSFTSQFAYSDYYDGEPCGLCGRPERAVDRENNRLRDAIERTLSFLTDSWLSCRDPNTLLQEVKDYLLKEYHRAEEQD